MSMCIDLPLTKAYVHAVLNAQPTQGLPMSIMQQMGRLCVDRLSSGDAVLDETVVCGLEHLEANDTNCMFQGLAKYRTFHSGTVAPFTLQTQFISQVLLADGHGGCDKIKTYERARRAPTRAGFFNSVLDIWDKTHCVHLCSAEQSNAFHTHPAG